MRNLIVANLIILLTLALDISARNVVSVQLIRSGDGALVDTAYLGYDHHFQILLENDYRITTLSFGFLISSGDGVTWTWAAQPAGYGNITHALTVIPGCRMDPPDEIFDATGFEVTENDVDGLSPDTLWFGGIAWMGGFISTGLLEPMVDLHFIPINSVYSVGTICIDSAFIPPKDPFIIGDMFGIGNPSINGPFCWPVKEFDPILGDFDLDWQITVGDAVQMISVIFKGKPHFAPVETGDANCDGSFNIGDAIYLIAYIFKHGPAPGCP